MAGTLPPPQAAPAWPGTFTPQGNEALGIRRIQLWLIKHCLSQFSFVLHGIDISPWHGAWLWRSELHFPCRGFLTSCNRNEAQGRSDTPLVSSTLGTRINPPEGKAQGVGPAWSPAGSSSMFSCRAILKNKRQCVDHNGEILLHFFFFFLISNHCNSRKFNAFILQK